MPDRREFFTAGRDICDSIKIEASTLDPQLDRKISRVVPEVIKYIVDNYYPFIPLQTLERVKTLQDRFFVTDTNTFNRLRKAWGKSTEDKLAEDKLDGAYLFLGDIMALKDPESQEYVWGKMTEKAKQSWIKAHKTPKQAKKEVGKMRFAYAFIHELVHAFHPKDTPVSVGFIEGGTSYYTREIARKLGLVNFNDLEEWEADIYGEFIKQHGEQIHKVFFGSESDPEKIKIIDQACTKYAFDI